MSTSPDPAPPCLGPLAPLPSTPLVVLHRGRGEPPLCSNASAVIPFWRRASNQSPIVWASRSRASATCAADQPRAKSQMACHRSRSRALGALYIRSRIPLTSNCHNPSTCSISFIAEPRCGSDFSLYTTTALQVSLCDQFNNQTTHPKVGSPYYIIPVGAAKHGTLFKIVP